MFNILVEFSYYLCCWYTKIILVLNLNVHLSNKAIQVGDLTEKAG